MTTLDQIEQLATQLLMAKQPELDIEIDGKKFQRSGQRAADVAAGMMIVVKALKIKALSAGVSYE